MWCSLPLCRIGCHFQTPTHKVHSLCQSDNLSVLTVVNQFWQLWIDLCIDQYICMLGCLIVLKGFSFGLFMNVIITFWHFQNAVGIFWSPSMGYCFGSGQIKLQDMLTEWFLQVSSTRYNELMATFVLSFVLYFDIFMHLIHLITIINIFDLLRLMLTPLHFFMWSGLPGDYQNDFYVKWQRIPDVTAFD